MARVRAFAAQEGQLAAQLEERKRQQLLDEKNAQLIREQSEELRELEMKIRAAYLNQDRRKQIDERKKSEHDERVRSKSTPPSLWQRVQELLDLQMEAARVRGLKEEEEKQRKRIEDGREAKRVLDEQIREQDEAKRRALEEFLKEKQMVDEIIQKILQEEEMYPPPPLASPREGCAGEDAQARRDARVRRRVHGAARGVAPRGEGAACGGGCGDCGVR